MHRRPETLRLYCHRLCQLWDVCLSLNYAPLYHPFWIYRPLSAIAFFKLNLFQRTIISREHIFYRQMQLENVLITRGIARPRNPRVSSHRWFRTRGVSARHHSGRTGRRDHPLVHHPLPVAVTAARLNECSLHFAHPREAHAPQSHHPVRPPSPLAADSYLRASRECVPPRRQTGKRISESIKVADSIIRRARPRWHQLLAIGVDHLIISRIEFHCFEA